MKQKLSPTYYWELICSRLTENIIRDLNNVVNLSQNSTVGKFLAVLASWRHCLKKPRDLVFKYSDIYIFLGMGKSWNLKAVGPSGHNSQCLHLKTAVSYFSRVMDLFLTHESHLNRKDSERQNSSRQEGLSAPAIVSWFHRDIVEHYRIIMLKNLSGYWVRKEW